MSLSFGATGALAQNDGADAEAVEGERCLLTRNIRETDIVDERTILFRMRGGDVYVNHLTNACRGLLRDEGFIYRPTTGRLCDVDTIRVLERFGGFVEEGAPCGLGMFYPITAEEAQLLKVEAAERRGRPRIETENPNARDEDEGEE